MALNIVDDETISISKSEMEKLMPEYINSQRYTTAPVSFESWYRNRKAIQEYINYTSIK